MFLCSTKSIFETSSIALIRIAQDNVGVFDFQLGSDRREMVISGEIDPHQTIPFKFQIDDKNDSNLYDELKNIAYQDRGDHLELLGINILNFEDINKKIEAQRDQLDNFLGFSPRWILPSKIRRVDTPDMNTSAMAIIIDSEREVDLQLVDEFTSEIIGRNEIMVSEGILNYLNIQPNKKKQVEVFFDILGIV